MKSKLFAAALMGSTALTPTPAAADPVTAFIATTFASAASAATAIVTANSFSAFLAISAKIATTTFVGQALVSVGLSAVSSALAKKRTAGVPQSSQERFGNFAQPISSMQWAFGRTRKGGPLAVTAFNDDKRHSATVLACHEIDGVDGYYVDQRGVDVDVDGNVITSPYDLEDPVIKIRPYLGGAGQVADQGLMDAIPEWTSSFDMKGLAYIAHWARRVSAKNFGDIYGSSPQIGPEFSTVIRGALVYDPRTDTTGFSDNFALVWAWVITTVFGFEVDWDDIAIEADHCDTLVTNRQLGQQKKWTLNGTFDDTADMESLRNQFIAAGDAYIYERTDGKFGVKVGRYIEPTVTLTEDDFYSLSISENEWGLDPTTEYVAEYIEPESDWIESPSATWVEETTTRVVRDSPSILFSNSHNQTMRCLKRIAKAGRPQFRLSGEIGMIGYELVGGNDGQSTGHRFVRVTAHGYDFVAEISSISRTSASNVLSIDAVSTLPTDWEFDAVTEEPPKPVRLTPSSDNSVGNTTGLEGTAVAGPGVELTWDIQGPALYQEIRYRVVGSQDWNLSGIIDVDPPFLSVTGLVDGQTYEFQIKNTTSAGRSSDWSSSINVVAIANATPPGPVVSFTSTLSASDVDLSWVSPNDANFSAAEVYRADYAPAYAGPFDIADASLIYTELGAPNSAQAVSDNGLSIGVYAWWIVAVNSSGIEGVSVGPETQEVI